MNIYALLSSKSNNLHMIKRYINFINVCDYQNSIVSEYMYVEIHHICPKGIFPQFDDLLKFPDNGVALTFRQHLIAHVMLWKIFGKSQSVALDCMLGKFNSNTNTTYSNHRRVPSSFLMRYLETVKLESYAYRGEQRRGYSTYKDSNNNRYFLHQDDPQIKALNLVGNNAGYSTPHSEEALQKRRLRDLQNKIITLYFLNCETKVLLMSPEFSEYLAQGWHTYKTEDDTNYNRQLGYDNAAKLLAGTANYMYPNTREFAGRLNKNDPKIQEFNLVPLVTDKHRAQWVSRNLAAVEQNRGSTIYNNGIIEIHSKEFPGEGWVKGRLPFSDEHKSNFLESTKKSNTDVIYWNNGTLCQKFPIGVNPGEGWVQGMLKRTKPNKPRQVETGVYWNNGIVLKRFPSNIDPGEGWIRGRLKRG